MPIPGEQFNNPASRTIDFVHGLRSRSTVSRSPLTGGIGIGAGAASLSRSTFQKYSHWNNRLGLQRSPLAFSQRVRSLRLPRLNLAHVMRFRRPYTEPPADYFSDDTVAQRSYEDSYSYYGEEPAQPEAPDYRSDAAPAAVPSAPIAPIRPSTASSQVVKRSVRPESVLPVFGNRMVARSAVPSVGVASARSMSFASAIAHSPEVRTAAGPLATPLSLSKSVKQQVSRVVARTAALPQFVQHRIGVAAPQAPARSTEAAFSSTLLSASPISVERTIGPSVQRIVPGPAPEIAMDLSLPPSAAPSRVMPADSVPNPERTVSDMRESAARSVEPQVAPAELRRQATEPALSKASIPAVSSPVTSPVTPGVQLAPVEPPRTSVPTTAAKQIARMVKRSDVSMPTVKRQPIDGVSRGMAFRKSLPIASAALASSGGSPKVQLSEAGSAISQPSLGVGPVERALVPGRISAPITPADSPAVRRMDAPPSVPSLPLAGPRPETIVPSAREAEPIDTKPDATEQIRRMPDPEAAMDAPLRREIAMRQAEVQRSETPKQEMQVPDLEMAHPFISDASVPDAASVSSPASAPDSPPMVRRTVLPAQPSIGPLAKGKAAQRTAGVQRHAPSMLARSIGSDVVQRWSGQVPQGPASSPVGPSASEPNMAFAGLPAHESVLGGTERVQRFLGEAGPAEPSIARSSAPRISMPDSITSRMQLNRISSAGSRVSRDSAEPVQHPMLERAPEKLLPVPSVSAGPRGVSGGSWAQRAPDSPAASGPAAAQSQQQAPAQQGLGNSAQPGSAGGSSDDAKDMAHQVWNILKRRLQVEAERQGKH